MISSLFTSKNSKELNSENVETNNIKFGTYNNSYYNNQPKNDEFTLDNLIQTLEKFKEEINSFFNIFDPLFYITTDNEFPNELTTKFNECKLPSVYIRIGFLFFYRKVDILIKTLSKQDLMIYENANKETTINEFITEHNNSAYIKDIEQIKLEFMKCFRVENEMLTMIKTRTPNYQPSNAIYTSLTQICIGIILEIQKTISDLFKLDIKRINDIQEEQFMNFLVKLHHFDICYQIFESYYLIPNDSIWDVPESDDEWVKMKEHFQRIVPYSQEHVSKLLLKVENTIHLGYASFSKGYSENTNDILQKASSGFYMAMYSLSKSRAKTQSMKFLLNPDTNISQTVWNLMDTKAFKTAVKVVLPSVQFCENFYLKRTNPEITLATIRELDQQIKSDNFDINTEIPKHSKVLFDQDTLEPEEIDELIKHSIKDETEKKRYVKIKLYNATANLNIPSMNSFQCFTNCCLPRNVNKTYDSLIIHIHGGGFVAMSPSSHENYTRKWVNKLNCPLVGIKYSLSPEFPFPKALDEVFQAYVWIINNMEKVFNVNIKNIIIAGDSAGGNLALSLVYLLIIKQIKLPKAIILAYPALKLSLKRMNLSYINSLSDPILEYNLLKFCLVSYTGECDEFNQFLSPLFMSDKIMKLLPPVRIICGSSDPLRDDSILLLKKLVDLNVDVKLKEIKYFPHAFLNYDYPVMVPEANIGNEIIVKEIEKLIKDNKTEVTQNNLLLE